MGHEFFPFLRDSNNRRSRQILLDELQPKAPKETVRRFRRFQYSRTANFLAMATFATAARELQQWIVPS